MAEPVAGGVISNVVRNKALAVGAVDWIEGLPDLVAGLERDWRITVGQPYDGATEAFVARAVLDDGTPAALKLMIPRTGDHAKNEMTVLRLAAGDGCLRLLRADPARDALLIERLGRSLDQLGLPLRRRHEILQPVGRQLLAAADYVAGPGS
jgi:streptomycin 6-kinase